MILYNVSMEMTQHVHKALTLGSSEAVIFDTFTKKKYYLKLLMFKVSSALGD